MMIKKANKKPGTWSKDFEREMIKRSEEFAAGNVKTYTWEETKQAATDSVAAKSKRP